MKKHISTILLVCIFLCGLALFLYPTISNFWNEYLNSTLISEYVEEHEEVTADRYDEIMEKAQAYNEYYMDKKKLNELGLVYEELLNPSGNGVMGYIEIPKISVQLVIYHSLDEGVLQSGLGHMENSALPVGGPSTHSVLAGHSGLPSAKLLTNLDQLALGDRFMIHTVGETLTYRVEDIAVVLPHEVDKLAVQTGRDLVTLVTCTPYGINSHRLLVRGTRVTAEEVISGGSLYLADEVSIIDPLYLLPICMIVLVILVGIGVLIQKIIKQKFGVNVHEENAMETME